MAQPRRYASPAERQAAYVARQAAARQAQLQAKGLPPLPAISSLPGEARWKALIHNAVWALRTATGEMQSYHDQRTEKWREGEKAEEFLARLDELTSILESILEFREEQAWGEPGPTSS